MPLSDPFDNTAPLRATAPVLPLIPKGDLQGQVAATTNVNIAATLDGVSINGFAVQVGDYVLLPAQTAPADNGVYTVNASPNVPTRATEFNTAAEFEAMRDSLQGFVETQGNNIGRRWNLVTQGAIVLGTTALIFAEDKAVAASV